MQSASLLLSKKFYEWKKNQREREEMRAWESEKKIFVEENSFRLVIEETSSGKQVKLVVYASEFKSDKAPL